MKKTVFLPALLLCLFIFAACGKKDEAPHYYEIRIETGQLEGLEKDQFLLGQQYYHGEPVSIIAEPPAAEGASLVMDVYIRPMGGEKQLFLSNVSKDYKSPGWYLDEKGRCFITGPSGVTRLDGDGKRLYKRNIDNVIMDICSLEDKIILMTNKAGSYQFLELDPDSGELTHMEKADLKGGYVHIGSFGKGLVILDDQGFWRMDLKKGTKKPELPFAGSFYFLSSDGESPKDLWADGNEAGILWSSGRVEQLTRIDITDTKEVITVRGTCPDWLKKQINLFNQSEDACYAVLEEPDAETGNADFLTETNLRLASGKGADIICSSAVSADVSGLIEKGIFADLAPMIAASGIGEADYFPAAFDHWRNGDKIYGIMPAAAVTNRSLDKAVLNGRKDLAIETLVDSLLEFEEDRCFSTNASGNSILEYFLEGSQNLWGMIDWDKGTCDFNGELFSKMLVAAKRYADDEGHTKPGIMDYPYCFGLYGFDTARKLEAAGQEAVGHFFDDGHHAKVVSGQSIVLGINAASEHTEDAWRLLAFLLGEESQSIFDMYRSHVFPVSISAYDRLAQAELEYGVTKVFELDGKTYTSFIPGRYGETIEEGAVAEMRQLLQDARSVPCKITPLLDIIKEETAYYFDGAKSMEEVISLVQNRVQLYLDERQSGK